MITIYKSTPAPNLKKPIPNPPLIGVGWSRSPVTIPNQNPYLYRDINWSFCSTALFFFIQIKAIFAVLLILTPIIVYIFYVATITCHLCFYELTSNLMCVRKFQSKELFLIITVPYSSKKKKKKDVRLTLILYDRSGCIFAM